MGIARRQGRVARVAAGVIVAGLVALAVSASAREEEPAFFSPPGVVLGTGTFEGEPWVYGISGAADGKPCLEVHMGGLGSGCVIYHAKKGRHLRAYTSSHGDSNGVMTAEGLLSADVESVITLSGGRQVGEVHVFDLPEKVGGSRRSFVAFVDESELAGEWVAIALDDGSHQIGRGVLARY